MRGNHEARGVGVVHAVGHLEHRPDTDAHRREAPPRLHRHRDDPAADQIGPVRRRVDHVTDGFLPRDVRPGDPHRVRAARHRNVGQPERGDVHAQHHPVLVGRPIRRCGASRREQLVLGGVIDPERCGIGHPPREVHLEAVEQLRRRLRDLLEREDVARLAVAAHHPSIHGRRITPRCGAGVRSRRTVRGRGSCGGRRSVRRPPR